MLPNFVYLPAEGENRALWLNLSNVALITESATGGLSVIANDDADDFLCYLTGQQARHLRAALAGQVCPQLPAIPAAEQLEARLERRGVIQ